jgi:hypothetical protein
MGVPLFSQAFKKTWIPVSTGMTTFARSTDEMILGDPKIDNFCIIIIVD